MVSDKIEASPQLCETFHEAVELIGRRWTGAIVAMMLQGAGRFCELRQAIPGISDRLLSERLRELEDEGILLREVGEGHPPTVSYTLSEKGRSLQSVFEGISTWAHDWGRGNIQAADSAAPL